MTLTPGAINDAARADKPGAQKSSRPETQALARTQSFTVIGFGCDPGRATPFGAEFISARATDAVRSRGSAACRTHSKQTMCRNPDFFGSCSTTEEYSPSRTSYGRGPRRKPRRCRTFGQSLSKKRAAARPWVVLPRVAACRRRDPPNHSGGPDSRYASFSCNTHLHFSLGRS